MMSPPRSRFIRVLTSAALVATALVFAVPSTPHTDAVAIPTYAYLGGGTGHHVHVIDDDTRLSWSATAAAFSPDSQFICVTSAYSRHAYRVSDGTNVWGALSSC